MESFYGSAEKYEEVRERNNREGTRNNARESGKKCRSGVGDARGATGQGET